MSPSNSTKAAQAKKQAQAQVRAQERRTLAIWIVVGIIVAGLFAALIAYIVRQGNISDIGEGEQLQSTVADETGGFGVAADGVVGEGLGDAPVRLDVYLDFICPFCAEFERIHADNLADLRAEGLVDVYYHPVAYLDGTSLGSYYSTRSAATAVLVAEESPEHFVEFLDLMMANQPSEGTSGLNDVQIQDIAAEAGVPGDVVDQIPGYPYSDWVRDASDAASSSGFNYTPALAIDGELVELNWLQDPASLEAALREAAAS